MFGLIFIVLQLINMNRQITDWMECVWTHKIWYYKIFGNLFEKLLESYVSYGSIEITSSFIITHVSMLMLLDW